MDNKISPSWKKIHEAIHLQQESVTIAGQKYLVSTASNGCRCVRYNDPWKGWVTIMEQNKHKDSRYAQRARNGETLSWVMPSDGSSWTLIDIAVRKPAPLVINHIL